VGEGNENEKVKMDNNVLNIQEGDPREAAKRKCSRDVMKFHDGDKTLEEKEINGKLTGLVERKRSPRTSRRNDQSAGIPEALKDVYEPRQGVKVSSSQVPVIVQQADQPTCIAELPCSSFLPLSPASRASLLFFG
ncbi:hypothetical protein U1Q18_037842, partial [Sarracenia purpurea var. burkii]